MCLNVLSLMLLWLIHSMKHQREHSHFWPVYFFRCSAVCANDTVARLTRETTVSLLWKSGCPAKPDRQEPPLCHQSSYFVSNKQALHHPPTTCRASRWLKLRVNSKRISGLALSVNSLGVTGASEKTEQDNELEMDSLSNPMPLLKHLCSNIYFMNVIFSV